MNLSGIMLSLAFLQSDANIAPAPAGFFTIITPFATHLRRCPHSPNIRTWSVLCRAGVPESRMPRGHARDPQERGWRRYGLVPPPGLTFTFTSPGPAPCPHCSSDRPIPAFLQPSPGSSVHKNDDTYTEPPPHSSQSSQGEGAVLSRQCVFRCETGATWWTHVVQSG